MNALKLGLIYGLVDLLEEKKTVPEKVERIMVLQNSICDSLSTSGRYEKGSDGEDVSDPRNRNLAGIRNQGMAIQAFHLLYSREAQGDGCKSIGTLSSFFEGGFVHLLYRTIELLIISGRGSALVAMQSSKSHSVALAYDGKDLYFFDPNSGIHEVTIATAAVDLAVHLTKRYTEPTCVHANMFKEND